jgi:hypothetical protein
MSEGRTLIQICKSEEMPSRATVYRWAEQDDEFRELLVRGRHAQAHYYFEKMMEVAFNRKDDFFVEGDKVVGDHVRVARDRLIADTLKFASSKLLPRTYGDKPETAPEKPEELVFRWEAHDAVVQPPPEQPPKQLPYHKPSLPADLDPQDWSLLLEVLECCKRTLPSGEDRLPGEVLEVLRKALLEYCRETENA